MTQNYLIPSVSGPLIDIPCTTGLREKWIGAMLDQTGRAYSGAFRLDFSSGCKPEKVLSAVVETFARHPVLAARFDIECDTLVGRAPSESMLYEILQLHLCTTQSGITDESFLAYRSKRASEPGLRIASTMDDEGLHVWIGFWVFTCDGASIDLLVEDIAHFYRGEPASSSRYWQEYARKEIFLTSKRVISNRDKLAAYPEAGPYGIDALRATSPGTIGQMQSIRFNSKIARRKLYASAKACRITPFVLLFSAFQHAISVVSGVTTIVTGVPFINRQRQHEHTIVGPVSTTVPVTTLHIPDEPFVTKLNQFQRAVIDAAGRQDIEPSALYPEGVSARTAAYELPYPQLFNAWNSQREGVPIALDESEFMVLHLLPNDTCRVGFEITLDEHTEYISGRFDLDINSYGKYTKEILSQMIIILDDIILKKT
ncbi:MULTISPECIES: condensation domain-containing protein [unclassified Brenneria]|uniref:condensation domain-containing protein n=1 Tax=unclassified Brenneria TaxID=2634434 RepID=UPI0015575E6C|nr:condensation domain-containing protein [Brenneria sp. hezel4-2-4]MEE3652790.1 condensation domain-containing protein [Brenneria sp. HEZEL_4_2_4]MEE3652795.1 condensation domain-containing protein [Brenneria sp. HEZEL_4_2_4]NPD02745.1 non-ribosomal peptide synthase [Brenneria sp. hezel4-2-4]NPD02750.1 non-ribosomal peptide synthase [Brenneria sp. hezel4-2-4]